MRNSNINFNEKNRIIVFNGQINDESCNTLTYFFNNIFFEDKVNKINNNKFIAKPIKFYIDSSGGYISEMWELIDSIISNSKITPVFTYAVGEASSSAAIIFLSGNKRFVSKHSEIKFHNIILSFEDNNLKEIKKIYDTNSKREEDLAKFVEEHTLISKNKYEKMLSKNNGLWTINAEEAILNKVADDYMENDLNYLESYYKEYKNEKI